MDKSNSEDMHPISNPDGRILLSGRDYAQFVTMLDNPKPPTPELREAMAEYHRLKAAYPDANL